MIPFSFTSFTNCFLNLPIFYFFLHSFLWRSFFVYLSAPFRFSPPATCSFSQVDTSIWLFCYAILVMVLLYICCIFCLLPLFVYGTLSSALSVGFCIMLSSDSSSYTFILTLSSVSVSVLVWSYYYLDSELAYRQFLGLILFFLASIFTLVFSADLLSLFVAWDLLGFTSFFLVVFYRSRASLAGGLLTGLTNRVGDVFLLVIFGLRYYRGVSSLSWSLFLLLVVSFTKSAQVPFSSWLPAAILAPTPVSALVHSSTLVTAGVFLLYRFFPTGSNLLAYAGIFTTLIAGLAAFILSDVKKIVALSTLSQLGLIISSLGVGERSLCFAHLNTHASFKALLFLAVGTTIHTMFGSQEVRSSGFLSSSSPTILIVIVSSCASMCGLVFLSGWVTKDAILERCTNVCLGLVFLCAFYLGIVLTIMYSLRLVFLIFNSMGSHVLISPSFGTPKFVLAPMYWLLLLSMVQGVVFSNISIITSTVTNLEDKFVV